MNAVFLTLLVATTVAATSTSVLPLAYGQSFSDATGILNRLDVSAGGYLFQVEAVSNFNIEDFIFDEDEKKLTLFISSGLENNLGEVIIPNDLLGGDLTFYLNDQPYSPTVNTNQQISFVTLKFTGSGENTLEIVGTTHLSGLVPTDDAGINGEHDSESSSSSLLLPQENRASDDSLEWQILVSSLVTVVAVILIVMKLRKRR